MSSKTISIRLDKDEFGEVETLVDSEGYSSKAALLRALIRKEWERWGNKVKERHSEDSDSYMSLAQAETELEQRDDTE